MFGSVLNPTLTIVLELQRDKPFMSERLTYVDVEPIACNSRIKMKIKSKIDFSVYLSLIAETLRKMKLVLELNNI